MCVEFTFTERNENSFATKLKTGVWGIEHGQADKDGS